MAALGIEEKGAVVVTAGQGWHPGVVGLVAARLKERFGRPAFAIALEPGGIGTGSGRSITGVDLGARGAPRGRRRPAASRAAATPWRPASRLRPDKLAAFRAYLEEALHDAVEQARHEDCAADRWRGLGRGRDRRDAQRHRARRAVRCRPCRAGVRAAVARRSPMRRRSGRRMCARGCAPATARCSTRSRSARRASRSAQALIENRGRSVHAAGTLSIDRWNGEERVQLRLMDMASGRAGGAVTYFFCALARVFFLPITMSRSMALPIAR